MNSDEVFPLETIGNTSLGTLHIVDCPFGMRTGEPVLRPGRYTLRILNNPGKPMATTPPNGPGLARIYGKVSPSDENNAVSLYYEPFDAGTLDRLLAMRSLEIEELLTLARALQESIETLREAGERHAIISAEYVGLTASGKPRLLLPERSYLGPEHDLQKNTELTRYVWVGEYVRSAAALLWYAACGYNPEPTAARVPLSLRLSPRTETETNQARSLGRAREYLLDAPAAQLARIGLRPVLNLDCNFRPINVYLSCSERARMLIPTAPQQEGSMRNTPLEKTQEKIRKTLESLGIIKQRGRSIRRASGRLLPLIPIRWLVSLVAGDNRSSTKSPRFSTSTRIGVTALTLAVLVASASTLVLNGGAGEASTRVHAVSTESPVTRDTPDVSETGDRTHENPEAVLRALLDQRNRERRARGGAELTLERIEDSARDGADLRVVAVVSASGYRPSAEEKQARKLSEENGVTRQKVIFELHRGEQGWEIIRAEPV